MALDKNN